MIRNCLPLDAHQPVHVAMELAHCEDQGVPLRWGIHGEVLLHLTLREVQAPLRDVASIFAR